MSKWYIATVTFARQRHLSSIADYRWAGTSFVAYEADAGCEIMVTALQILYTKGVEWRCLAHIYTPSADIACASVNVTVRTLCDAMQLWAVPCDIAAAF